MTVTEIQITKLKEYENNPRHNEGAVDAVAASIKNFGFKVPIVIDKDNVIIAGHTRLRAASKLGIEKVPCIVADDLTPEQVKAFRLADNKTAEFAEWDYNKLEAELYELQDVDMSIFGFDDEKISADDFGEDFSLPDSDIPQKRTITLTLAPEQFKIAEKIIEHFSDSITHNYDNENTRSNAFFEGVFAWASANDFIDEVEYGN